MTMLSSSKATLLHVQRAPSSIWKRRSPCSSACCPAEALRVVIDDHDDAVVVQGDVAACAAGAELDLEAKEPI
jgi:quercetin dioxygenase-like cupin family protein